MTLSADLQIEEIILERLEIPRRLGRLAPGRYISYLHWKYKTEVGREGIDVPGEEIARIGRRAVPHLLRDFFVPWKNKVSTYALNRILSRCTPEQRSEVLSRIAQALDHSNPTVKDSAIQLLKDWNEPD